MRVEPLQDINSYPVQIGSVIFNVTMSNRLYATEKDFFFLPHNHSIYEIQYFSEGSCRIKNQKCDYTAKKGDICIAHPYEYHTFIKPEDENMHLLVCSMYLAIEKEQTEDTDSSFTLQAAESLLNSNYHIHDPTERVGKLFSLIQNELDEGKHRVQDAVRGLITTLLANIFQLLIPEGVSMEKAVKSMSDSARMITIERFFLFNYHRDVTVYDLAGELFVCTRRVNQILREMYDCSFTQKLLVTRLEVAKFLLKHSDYTVSDICSMCGFRAKNYFNTAFRQEYGMPPSEFRKAK